MSTQPEKPELRPCPFCGSTYVVCRLYAVSTVLSGAKTRRGKPALQGWSVECLQCQASVNRPNVGEDSKAAAISRWNHRADDGPDLEEIAARESAIEERNMVEEATIRNSRATRARDDLKRRNT